MYLFKVFIHSSGGIELFFIKKHSLRPKNNLDVFKALKLKALVEDKVLIRFVRVKCCLVVNDYINDVICCIFRFSNQAIVISLKLKAKFL